jgi:hypothetical protein
MAGDDASPKTGVVYLARGADDGALADFGRFVACYSNFPAGLDHQLIIALKGFAQKTDIGEAKQLFGKLDCTFIEVDDGSYDIGAYVEAAHQVECEFVCFLNTRSELLAKDWLKLLDYHLHRQGTGMVGASGSFESLESPGFVGPSFPNPHLRSNAFAIGRELFLRALDGRAIRDKLDAYHVESGARSLTRAMMSEGLEVRVVGRNGRAYPPQSWPMSGTYRQGAQENLLVHDRQTRTFEAASVREKLRLMSLAWGNYVDTSDFVWDEQVTPDDQPGQSEDLQRGDRHDEAPAPIANEAQLVDDLVANVPGEDQDEIRF